MKNHQLGRDGEKKSDDCDGSWGSKFVLHFGTKLSVLGHALMSFFASSRSSAQPFSVENPSGLCVYILNISQPKKSKSILLSR